MDDLHFRAHFERMAPYDTRVVHLRVPGRGVLELGIGRLPPHPVKPADILRVQTAGKLRKRGQARDTVEILHAGAAQEWRLFACNDVSEAQPELEQGMRRDRPRVAKAGALGKNAHEAIAIAARRAEDRRLVELV